MGDNPSASEFICPPAVFRAARELIAEADGCVVDIGELLDNLSDKFSDEFAVTPEMYRLVNLIEALWNDPHIHQVPEEGSVEFAWHERSGRAEDLRSNLNLASLRSKLLGDRAGR